MSYNKIIVIGNLTRDPEKRLVGETSLLKFGIASSHKYSELLQEKIKNLLENKIF